MRKSIFFVFMILLIDYCHAGHAGTYERTFKHDGKVFVREIKETLIAECGSLIDPEKTEISPDGRKIMWLADIMDKRAVMLNSEVIGIYEDATSFVFSPDSRRIAYKVRASHKMAFIIDGESSESYEGVFSFQFSPDSKRYSFIAKKNEKCCAVIDGTEGDLYEIIGPVVFSPDSKHVAYVAYYNEDQGYIVYDGEATATQWMIGLESLVFSSNSEHFAFTAVDKKEEKFFCVINGKAEKEYANNFDPVYFSPDSKHIAFSAADEKEMFYVIDGKKQPNYASVGKEIFFSPDSNHYAYVAATKKGWHVIKDGDEGRRFLFIFANSLKFSPDSRHFVYQAIEPFSWSQYSFVREMPFHLIFAVVRDDKVELRKNPIVPESIVFSPDSSRLAFTEINEQLLSCIVVDGKQYKTHDNYMTDPAIPVFPVFTGNSKFIIYAVKKGEKWFVVVEENEGNEYDNILGPLDRCIILDGLDGFHYIAQKGHNAYLVEERIRPE